jgi:HlyD family secretion protein
MNVDAQFIGDQLQNALVVPTVAVVTQGGETGVLGAGGQSGDYFPASNP